MLASLHSLVLLTAATMQYRVAGGARARAHRQRAAPHGHNCRRGRVRNSIRQLVPLPILAGLLFAQTASAARDTDRPLQVLVAALGPMALLLVVSCAGAHTHWATTGAGAAVVAMIKNLALPATLGTLAWALGLSGPAIAVMFTAAAMPVGAKWCCCSPQRYGVMKEEVSSAIALSTALALITLPVVLVLAQFFMH